MRAATGPEFFMFGPPGEIEGADSICNLAAISGIESTTPRVRRLQVKFVPLFLLCWISSAAAQTFHIEPANPILVGEPLAIRLDGLPADKNVTLTAERTIEAPNRAGVQVLYRSQVVFSAPQGSLDLATAKPLSGSYTDADIRGLFWSMAPVAGGEVGGLKPLQVKLTAAADGRELTSTTVEFIDSLPEVKVEQVKEFPGAVFATLPGSARRPAVILLGGSEGGGGSRAMAHRASRREASPCSGFLIIRRAPASARFPSCRLRSRIFPSIDSTPRSSG